MTMDSLLKTELPIFTILNSKSHQGDVLQNRVLILHSPTMSVFEALDLQECELRKDSINFKYEYINPVFGGMIESLAFVLIKSELEQTEMKSIFLEMHSWFCDYMKWYDQQEFVEQII
jgi:hypothetical protein